MEVLAPAKVNLTLDILGRRPDGYHELRMIMHSVALTDRLTLTQTERPGVRVSTNLRFLPSDRRNLAAQAALHYGKATGISMEGLHIDIQKSIPVCAGMAGGSTDAAAVLRALNRRADKPMTPEALARLGAQVGSDVPYCVLGGTALAQGRGETLTPLAPLPECFFVLCKPPFPISTPQLFAQVNCQRFRRRPDTEGMIKALEEGDLAGVARRMYNVFEDVLSPRQGGVIGAIKATLIGQGALGAVMSGSGPTVLGIFQEEAAALRAQAVLKEEYSQVFMVKNV